MLAVNTDRVNVDPPSFARPRAQLARPSACPEYTGEAPPSAAFKAEHYLAEWFRATAGAAGRRPRCHPPGSGTTGRAEQESWAQTTYDALARL